MKSVELAEIDSMAPDGDAVFEAFRDVGFLRLVGLDRNPDTTALIERVINAAQRLYRAECEPQRNALAQKTERHYRRFVTAKKHQKHFKDAFDFGDRRFDTQSAFTASGEVNIPGPTTWPSPDMLAPEECAAIEGYYALQLELGKTLMAALLPRLGLDHAQMRAFGTAFDDSISTLRILRYPAVPARTRSQLERAGLESLETDGLEAEPAESELVPYSTPIHVDSGFLTLLLLADDAGGLEIEDPRSGEWREARYPAGSIVVNLGRTLSIISKGVLQPTRHRVRSPL